MDKKFSREEIFQKLSQILQQDFEIAEALIVPDSDLFEDLEFDSIDAVDLAVRLQQYSDKKFSPEEFKKIKTVNDVVEAIYGKI